MQVFPKLSKVGNIVNKGSKKVSSEDKTKISYDAWLIALNIWLSVWIFCQLCTVMLYWF